MIDLKNTLRFWAFTAFKIPVLFFLRPRVQEISAEQVVLRVPLSRRAKNHLNSMFFGSLCAGADATWGFLLLHLIDQKKAPVVGIVKGCDSEFYKRAEGDVVFRCSDGVKISKLIDRALQSGQREDDAIEVVATVPSQFGADPVAKFLIKASIKRLS